MLSLLITSGQPFRQFYVQKTLVRLLSAAWMAFVTTEGFGNNHVDFTSHIEQIVREEFQLLDSHLSCTGRSSNRKQVLRCNDDNNKSMPGIENSSPVAQFLHRVMLSVDLLC